MRCDYLQALISKRNVSGNKFFISSIEFLEKFGDMSSSLLYLSSQVLQLHHISFPVIHKASKAYQVWPMIKEGGSVLAPLLNNTYTRLISQAFQEGSRKKRRMNKKGQKSPFLVSSVTHHQLSNIHFVAIDFQTGQKNRLEQIERF